MRRLIELVTSKLRSPSFFAIILAVFIMQGLFFAVAVNPSKIYVIDSGLVTRGGGVVPDGNRHIGAIYYFAEQPLLHGPHITDQTSEELWMGDLERFPSYLYYYLMSLPIRLSTALGAPDIVNVLIIRIIGLAIGVAALFVFRKIARELKVGEVIVNLSTLGLAVTGSFAYLAPSENYDILALLTFFLFILAAIRLYTRRDSRYLYLMVIWFFVGGITKYTYIPFMGVAGLMSLYLLAKAVGWRQLPTLIGQQFSGWVKLRPWLASLAVVGLLVAGGLFAERIGGNLLQYRSFSPSCAVIHKHEDCMTFGVYARNYNRQQKVDSGKVDKVSYNPIEYTGFWLGRYYTSMYAYVGHIWIYEFWWLMFVGLGLVLAAVLAAFVYAKRKRQKVLTSVSHWYIMALVSVLVVAQYLFNLETYLNFAGEAYAHQGRYLLSAIGFVYVLLLLVVAAAYRAMSRSLQQKALPVLLTIGLIALLTNSALPVFLVHADTAEWYSQAFKFLAG